ncbi:tRNA pseudouridine(55) synthase [hydrothermal vent metagenome]|uniref:tRNA pseudouridine(55) synthase n=1 Tax=hydrothermal vent metagenome TaxID=652676 RepID=A0A3B1ANZ5_9ZZZZ
MGRQKQRGRNVQGILLLDKPLGITSNAALQQVKRIFRARKAGHTGSLDPLANGLLPICFGSATKISAYLLDANKHYRVKVKLGITTTTADAEGEVLETRPVEGVTEPDVRKVLEGFLGEIQQLPPMYSALKHNGERLYKLARQGIEVEREPRGVTIYALELLSYDLLEIELDVSCSKGTYIRTLAEDVGEALGCGAHVSALRRTGVGPFGMDGMVDAATIEATAELGLDALDQLLLPVDSAVSDWPEVRVSDDAAYYLRQGQAVQVPKAPTEGWVRLYAGEGVFLGVGQIQDDGKVATKRLI